MQNKILSTTTKKKPQEPVKGKPNKLKTRITEILNLKHILSRSHEKI